MRGRIHLMLAVLPLLSVAWARPAAAQDLAAAEALFDKGIKEMEAGRFDAACPALAESQRLDPRPGTLFALADCQDRAGKIASAAALYNDYLRLVAQMTQASKLRHNDRVQVATARRAALAPEVPELTLVLPESAPKDVVITRDGTSFTATSLGIALPLDPGEHLVTTRVGDGPLVEQRITLGRGEKKTVTLEVKLPGPAPAAVPAPSAPPSRPAAAPPPPRTHAPPPIGADADSGMSGRRIGALVAGGIGVAGLALGGVTGAMALSKRSVIRAHCEGAVCDAEGKAAADAIQLPGTLSTIGFGVGAASVAAGLILWLTEPRGPEVGEAKPKLRAMVDAGPAGAALGVKGVW